MSLPWQPALRGLAAGALGTAAMTAWQELSSRLQSAVSEDSASGADRQADGRGVPEKDSDPWEDAPVPAKVAQRAAEGLFGWRLPPERIPLITTVMHWAYGTGWGVPYGIWARSARPDRPLRAGALFGIAVWTMSYAQLVPMGLYEPPWRYPVADLALDLSYHLAYGVGTGMGFELVAPAFG